MVSGHWSVNGDGGLNWLGNWVCDSRLNSESSQVLDVL